MFGNLKGKAVVLMQGRAHLYEGYDVHKVGRAQANSVDADQTAPPKGAVYLINISTVCCSESFK